MTLEELKAMGATVNGFLLRFRRHFAYAPLDIHNPLENKALTETHKGRMARNGALSAQTDARLTELAACWAELSENEKTALLTLARGMVK